MEDATRDKTDAGARADDASAFDPEGVTGWTLVRAYQLVARRFQETFADVGLTPTHFGVLVQLARNPGISQAALARSVFITPQGLGGVLTTMQERGLVSRGDASPGRPTPVALTEAGRAALHRAMPAVVALNRPHALGLTPAENQTLNTLLHKVRRKLAAGE